MFRELHFVLVIAALLLTLDQVAYAAPLTKADIPADLPPNVRLLLEQTFSQNVHERGLAVRKLGAMRGAQAAAAVPFLIRLFDDTEWDKNAAVHYHAREAVVAMGEPALDACITAAKAIASRPPGPVDDDDARVIRSLGQFKSPRADEALVELLKARNSRVQQSAMLALDGRWDPRATMPLLNIVEQGQGRMRLEAAHRLQKLQDSRAVEPLLKLLQDHVSGAKSVDPALAVEITAALGAQRDRRAAPIFIEIVQQPTRGELLRNTALVSIGQISDPASVQLLADILSDRQAPEPRRSSAATGLGLYRPSGGEPAASASDETRVLTALEEVLRNNEDSFFLRVHVAEALGELGNPGAVPALCTVAGSHKDDYLGFQAAVNAVKLTDGKLQDVGVVTALQNYQPLRKDHGELKHQAKLAALAKLAANGSWQVRYRSDDLSWLVVVVATNVGLALIGVAVWYFVKRRKQKSR